MERRVTRSREGLLRRHSLRLTYGVPEPRARVPSVLGIRSIEAEGMAVHAELPCCLDRCFSRTEVQELTREAVPKAYVCKYKGEDQGDIKVSLAR